MFPYTHRAFTHACAGVLLSAVGCAFTLMTYTLMISEAIDEATRGTALGLLGMAQTLGFGATPLVGGVVFEHWFAGTPIPRPAHMHEYTRLLYTPVCVLASKCLPMPAYAFLRRWVAS